MSLKGGYWIAEGAFSSISLEVHLPISSSVQISPADRTWNGKLLKCDVLSNLFLAWKKGKIKKYGVVS
jgi:hypothetical protein